MEEKWERSVAKRSSEEESRGRRRGRGVKAIVQIQKHKFK